MENSLISVIIPVYNTVLYVGKCIESVINQTYPNLEIVLIDDGSSDGSGRICDDYALKDKRIKVIHKENEGVTRTRITGYRASSGEFIAFLDSDDYLASNALEVLVKAQEKGNADVVVCNICEVTYNKKKCRRQMVDHFYDYKEIEEHLRSSFLYDPQICMAEIPLYLCGKLFRRSILVNALEQGLDIWYEEDLVSMIYVLYHVQSMQTIGDQLYYYVMHDGQTSQKNPFEIFKQMKKARGRISSFDSKYFLDEQLLFRYYGETKDTLVRLFNYKISYNTFRHFFIKNRMSFEMQNFMDLAYSPSRLSDKLMYNMLKYRQCVAYYLFLNLRNIIKGS